MFKSKPEKQHRHASTGHPGEGVPSIWLPSPGGSIVYVAGGPPASAASASPPSTSVPSHKCKRGVHSLPHTPNVARSSSTANDNAAVPAQPSTFDGVDDDNVAKFFTAAFKLLVHNVQHLLDSEHKRNISNVLRSFTEVLPNCEAPAILDGDGDEDANAA